LTQFSAKIITIGLSVWPEVDLIRHWGILENVKNWIYLVVLVFVQIYNTHNKDIVIIIHLRVQRFNGYTTVVKTSTSGQVNSGNKMAAVQKLELAIYHVLYVDRNAIPQAFPT